MLAICLVVMDFPSSPDSMVHLPTSSAGLMGLDPRESSSPPDDTVAVQMSPLSITISHDTHLLYSSHQVSNAMAERHGSLQHWSKHNHTLPHDIQIKEEPIDIDASPPPDLSCGTSTGSSPVSTIPRRKKLCNNMGKAVEEELCLICGDRASGYHYNALSCEGCKGFFRRSVTRGASYVCKYGGHCEIDMWMRRKCQFCRLRRCREVGMKEECLLSDEQCKARDVRRKARQRVQKVVTSSESACESHPSPDSNTHESVPPTMVGPVPNPLEWVSQDHRLLIEKLVYYQDKFELPDEEDVKKIEGLNLNVGAPDAEDFARFMWKRMAEMTILVTQLVVEFAKHLPGFLQLNRDDQISLLKNSASEVMMLRTARRYDVETDTVVFADGNAMTRDTLRVAGLGEYVDLMFDFCRSMGHMEVDNAEYALLTAVSILSERAGMHEGRQVEDLQEMYTCCLHSYTAFRRPAKSNHFAKLLMKLTDLRSLSLAHSKVLLNLRLSKGSMPPLLGEFFDLTD